MQSGDPMIQKLGILLDSVNRVAYLIGAIVVGLMMVQVTVHALAQFLFGYPIPGTVFFISNYYMVVASFLCIGAVQTKNRHIDVDLVTNRLPACAKRILSGVAYVVTMIVFALLAWQSFKVAESRRAAGIFELEYDIKFLIWPSYYIVPIGAALMVLTTLYQLLRLVSGAPEDAAKDPESIDSRAADGAL
jgi:TRAP-type C4-dicarboxylate transport system permease small subunit